MKNAQVHTQDHENSYEYTELSVAQYQKRVLGRNIESSLRRRFMFTSVLYVVAAISECAWFWVIYQNRDALRLWVESLPFLGWMFVFIFSALAIIVPFLAIIGIQMVRLVKKADAFRVTPSQLSARKNVNMLLIVGIVADICIPLFLDGAQDKSAVIFVAAMFCARIFLANYMAVAMALSVKKQ